MTGEDDDIPLEGDFLDKWVFPYLKEPALWPVAFAIIGHIDVVVGMAILGAVRSTSPLSTAGLFLLVGLSGKAVVDERKAKGAFGPIGALVAIVWSTSSALAWVADHYGYY
jgi:hypothetical protein